VGKKILPALTRLDKGLRNLQIPGIKSGITNVLEISETIEKTNQKIDTP
jgi:hypothetical protein